MKTRLLSFVILAAFLLLALDCGSARAESLYGTWMDPETDTTFLFTRAGSGPVLSSIIDDDGERYVLKAFS